MDALLFALALEVTLLQLRIQEGSSELRSRYWSYSNEREKAQHNKLLLDREVVRESVMKGLVELVEAGRCRALRRAVQALRHRGDAAAAASLAHDRLRQKREAITGELKSMGNQFVQELSSAGRKVALLRDKLKDDLLNASTRLRYADKWLSARAEAAETRWQRPFAPAPSPGHEERVHSELVKAFLLQIKEREEVSDYWRIRYSDDLAEINEKIANIRDVYMEAIKCREQLQNVYDLHEGEMRGWLTFKRERAARLAREDRLRRAATRAQSWWRGVMVRRALGPFKHLKNAKKQQPKSKKK
ncbi:dynein regulatory complex protein 9-like [Cydia fagiglandana]|uniref:dynein regulatory complex protein 9-like n=1 Tax=Cydia fagiglandana TaxID=1458189 RepID=UPI002FEE540C